MRSHWLRDIGRSGSLTGECLSGSDVPQPGGFGCGGDFASPIQSPFTDRGFSEWGDRVLVSAFIIFLLLMHAIIIQEGERMTRMGTYGLKLDQQSYKPFMLYWNKIKATNILNVDVFSKHLYQSRYAI